MELKCIISGITGSAGGLLIEPYGIEICKRGFDISLSTTLLIEPYGIEMNVVRLFPLWNFVF